MGISPRLIKRTLSAVILIPLALALLSTKLGFIGLVAAAFLIAAYEWLGMVRAAPRRKIQIALVGVIYLPVCFLAFCALRFMPEGMFIIFTLMFSVWFSDTGAYVIGKAIGGPKWVPSISPNKTWAGVGGAMLGAGCVVPWWSFFYSGHLPQNGEILPMMLVIGAYFLFGCVLGFVCQIGDLFISVFKRRAGVKDTGALIPGHGGLLDRIDALMLASVFVYLVLRFCGPMAP